MSAAKQALTEEETPSQERFFATPEEYLFYEAQATAKHEYREGEVLAMAGGTVSHNMISGRVFGELYARLKKTPCRVLNSDMKLAVAEANAFFYPDAMVICGAPELWEERNDAVCNPTIIIEVLSPSTETYDRKEKFISYQKLSTLKDYVLIDAQQARIEVFSYQAENQWQLHIFDDVAQDLHLPSLDLSIPMAEIYADLKL
ncbi:MAG: Uma2 family endonuclease [Bernardetiaceae bacterium]|nr:Uma2 family endonuclease [Bernardetiaceae bacterium]